MINPATLPPEASLDVWVKLSPRQILQRPYAADFSISQENTSRICKIQHSGRAPSHSTRNGRCSNYRILRCKALRFKYFVAERIVFYGIHREDNVMSLELCSPVRWELKSVCMSGEMAIAYPKMPWPWSTLWHVLSPMHPIHVSITWTYNNNLMFTGLGLWAWLYSTYTALISI